MNLAYQELYLVLAGIFRVYDAAPLPASMSGKIESLEAGVGGVYKKDASWPEGKYLALYDTIRERDVDLVHDLLVPGPVKGSKGVRVMVL